MRILVTGGAGVYRSKHCQTSLRPMAHDVVGVGSFYIGHFRNLIDFPGGMSSRADAILNPARLGSAFDVLIIRRAITGVVSAQNASTEASPTIRRG